MTLLVSAGAFVAGASLAMTGGAAQASQPNSDWNEIIAKFDNVSSNVLCFDSPDNFTVQLWHCHASGSTGVLQRWQFVLNQGQTQFWGEPIYTIENLQTGRCLINAGTTSGSAATQAFCPNAFLAVNLAPGTNPLLGISVPGTNLCLEPANFSDSNGTRLVFNTCNPNDIQQTLSFLP
ncbi:MAG TPA: ricin-type beta-trefoil lectin domain protein [Streptosporangiaceae bacterium]|nr:ricin-type beta-trefoil lectin domain protein [Streptosporangiaceae bacterium]